MGFSINSTIFLTFFSFGDPFLSTAVALFSFFSLSVNSFCSLFIFGPAAGGLLPFFSLLPIDTVSLSSLFLPPFGVLLSFFSFILYSFFSLLLLSPGDQAH